MNGILRVVFDTNILFSAVAWQGSPYQCVQGAREGKCFSFTCEAILAELAGKLVLKRGLDESTTREITDEIRLFSQMVSIAGELKVVAADPDDDAVLECAVVGQAQYLVSGDRHLLALGRFHDVQIVKAADFLAQLQNAPMA